MEHIWIFFLMFRSQCEGENGRKVFFASLTPLAFWSSFEIQNF